MHSWDAGQYLRFADERTRPALDLLAQVDIAAPRRVVDLGCGPGNSTALLRERWPDAVLEGLDASQDMLAAARRDHPGIAFVAGDIATWLPAEPYDVVFSNAALQWVGNHAELLPRLIASVRPGGALAVQMPRNHDFATHALMRRVATEGPWRDRLAGAREPSPVQPPEILLRLSGAAESPRDPVGDQLHSGYGRGRGDYCVAARHRPWAVPRPARSQREAAIPGAL